jgi:hypothetical protein
VAGELTREQQAQPAGRACHQRNLTGQIIGFPADAATGGDSRACDRQANPFPHADFPSG